MIMVVIGTRPEIVKMAPVVHACQALGVDFEIVHTGQHYDREMSSQFMEELELPEPDHYLNVRSGTQAVQTSRALVRLEKAIASDKPSAVLVQGDTNTALAGAIASVKLQVPVCHVEAGLRSYDLRMPEEHNRRIVDHISSILFAPTRYAARVLHLERVWGKIHVTGNTVIDSCLMLRKRFAVESTVLDQIRFDRYALATFHRAESVDYPSALSSIVKVLSRCPQPVVFPVHPRTLGRLRAFGLESILKRSDNTQLLPPVGYLDFLNLMAGCEYILTDSGGVQEEATAPNIRKFVFVLRKSTDRPESIAAGFARLVGTEDSESILRTIRRITNRGVSLPRESPYGDGKAGMRIGRIVGKHFA